MGRVLSLKEVYERMKEWRNMKKLHFAARQRVETLEKMIRIMEEKDSAKDEIVKNQDRIIQTLELRIEELERMIFGKKKDVDGEGDSHDPDNGKSPKQPRGKSSFKRPIPKEDEVTDREYY